MSSKLSALKDFNSDMQDSWCFKLGPVRTDKIFEQGLLLVVPVGHPIVQRFDSIRNTNMVIFHGSLSWKDGTTVEFAFEPNCNFLPGQGAIHDICRLSIYYNKGYWGNLKQHLTNLGIYGR